MKSCPNCRQSFADMTYNFCLDDGSPLVFVEEQEVETIVTQEIETIISHRNHKIDLLSSNNFAYAFTEPIIAINIA